MKWIPVNEKLPDCDDKWGISKIVLCLDARGRAGFGIYQNGEKQYVGVGGKTAAGVGVVGHHHEKQQHLHAKAHQVAHDNTERHNQARKVNLPEDIGVVSKNRAGFGEAVGKVVPGSDSSHVKQRLGQAVGTKPCKVAKNEGKDDGREKRLDKKPQRAQDGLLVKRHKIPLNQQPQ